jgi:anaerobic selenocysteine-containing dehydrogenase
MTEAGAIPMPHHLMPTTCVLDCPDTCGLEVSVEDGRIKSIQGSKEHPLTRGFICSKVSGFAERVYHQDRLLYPMRRRGAKGAGDFERISWEEAIGEIVRRFQDIRREWGGEAILPYHYGGSNGFLTDGFLDGYFFARLGASRLDRTLCAAPTGAVAAAMYGKMPGVAFEDYVHAKFILVWGANPRASNIHLVPFLQEAKRRGAFIATIDPVRTFSKEMVDLHLPVYPGADLPLALALVRYWRHTGRLDREFLERHADGVERLLSQAEAWTLERASAETRLALEDLRLLADRYAEASPAVLRCGWGVERNQNGGRAVAAILALPALLGKFGVPGGGYTLSNSGAGRLEAEKIFGRQPWETRLINMTRLGAVLNQPLDPPVKALFVFNCNPVATVPDQNAVLRGLAREDLFTVVFEQLMTDTARYADILLPATTFMEHDDIRRGYGAYVLGGARPVIAPCGEARSNPEVFAALGRAFGFSDPPFFWSAEERFQKAASAISLYGEPADAASLAAGRFQLYDFPGSTPVQFGTVFPKTSDGKIHLTPEVLGADPFAYLPVRSEKFPLALISPGTSRMVSSTFGETNYRELFLSLHPEDAAARGIAEGDRVRVFNEWGEVHCRARLFDGLARGVASIPKGAWRKSSLNGQTATALAPPHVDPVAGGACFMDARVEVALLS